MAVLHVSRIIGIDCIKEFLEFGCRRGRGAKGCEGAPDTGGGDDTFFGLVIFVRLGEEGEGFFDFRLLGCGDVIFFGEL